MCSCEKAVFESKIGDFEVSFCISGVHYLRFITDRNKNDVDEKLSMKSYLNSSNVVLKWLASYFSSTDVCLRNTPPVCPSVFSGRGDFTANVWKTLMTVKFGQTVSYSQLATLSGYVGASRAVGSAMKINPIPIIIPCHRVIKSDGKLGQFGCGTNIKKWLLNHEGVYI